MEREAKKKPYSVSVSLTIPKYNAVKSSVPARYQQQPVAMVFHMSIGDVTTKIDF